MLPRRALRRIHVEPRVLVERHCWRSSEHHGFTWNRFVGTEGRPAPPTLVHSSVRDGGSRRSAFTGPVGPALVPAATGDLRLVHPQCRAQAEDERKCRSKRFIYLPCIYTSVDISRVANRRTKRVNPSGQLRATTSPECTTAHSDDLSAFPQFVVRFPVVLVPCFLRPTRVRSGEHDHSDAGLSTAGRRDVVHGCLVVAAMPPRRQDLASSRPSPPGAHGCGVGTPPGPARRVGRGDTRWRSVHPPAGGAGGLEERQRSGIIWIRAESDAALSLRDVVLRPGLAVAFGKDPGHRCAWEPPAGIAELVPLVPRRPLEVTGVSNRGCGAAFRGRSDLSFSCFTWNVVGVQLAGAGSPTRAAGARPLRHERRRSERWVVTFHVERPPPGPPRSSNGVRPAGDGTNESDSHLDTARGPECASRCRVRTGHHVRDQ
jgi:hypothetical protein